MGVNEKEIVKGDLGLVSRRIPRRISQKGSSPGGPHKLRTSTMVTDVKTLMNEGPMTFGEAPV